MAVLSSLNKGISFEEACKQLISRLTRETSHSLSESLDLESVKQQPNECCFDFYMRLMEKLLPIGVPREPELIRLLVPRLLPAVKAKLEVLGQNVVTLDELLDVLKVIDGENSAQQQQHQQITTSVNVLKSEQSSKRKRNKNKKEKNAEEKKKSQPPTPPKPPARGRGSWGGSRGYWGFRGRGRGWNRGRGRGHGKGRGRGRGAPNYNEEPEAHSEDRAVHTATAGPKEKKAKKDIPSASPAVPAEADRPEE